VKQRRKRDTTKAAATVVPNTSTSPRETPIDPRTYRALSSAMAVAPIAPVTPRPSSVK
jgi:hypothetical protein